MARTTNDLLAVRMVAGPGPHVPGGYYHPGPANCTRHGGHQPPAHRCSRCVPLLGLPVAMVVAGPADPPPQPGHPGAVQRAHQPGPRESLRRPGGPGLPAGAGRDRRLPAAERRLPASAIWSLARVQGLFFPLLTLLGGLSALIVLYAGGRLVMAGHGHRRRVRGLRRVPRDAGLADDRARLGGQPGAARRRVDGPDQPALPGARPRSPSPTAPARAAAGTRRAARWSSATSGSRYPGRARAGLGAAGHLVPGRGGAVARHRGRHRLGQVHAGGPAGPGLRPRPRAPSCIDGVDIRRLPLAELRARGRVRAAGDLPLQRDAAATTSCSARPTTAGWSGWPRWPSSPRRCPRCPNGYDTMLGERGINLSRRAEAAEPRSRGRWRRTRRSSCWTTR